MKIKKGQTEIIGLAIIVVIITMVIMFGLVFKVAGKNQTVGGTFANDQLASNFLTAILKTDHLECGTSIADMIQDCATNQDMVCRDGHGTCYHVNQSIGHILNASLELLQSKYVLRIVKIPSTANPTVRQEITRFERDCGPRQTKGMQGYQPLTLWQGPSSGSPGRVDVTLDVCK